MYGVVSVIVNAIVLIILLLIYLAIRRKDQLSMFDYRIVKKLFIIIAPCIVSIINLSIDFKFKPKIFYWIVSIVPMIVPILVFIIDYIRHHKIEVIYKNYYSDIKNSIGEKIGELEIYDSTVNLFLYYDNKVLCCKVVIKLKLSEDSERKIEKEIESYLNLKYKEIKFNIFINNY